MKLANISLNSVISYIDRWSLIKVDFINCHVKLNSPRRVSKMVQEERGMMKRWESQSTLNILINKEMVETKIQIVEIIVIMKGECWSKISVQLQTVNN